jgi:hypothetical protein
LKDSKKIKLNDEQYEIKKMPIRKFANLMRALDELPKKLQNQFSLDELENLSSEALLLKIPSLIGEFQDELFNLVSIASGIKKETIEELSFEEFLDVIMVVFEINNIGVIVDKLKNLGKVLQTK